jgi:hypothetical protein
VKTIAENLATVQDLLVEARPADAESLLSSVIQDNSARLVKDYEPDVRAILERFLPKRRRRLAAILESRIGELERARSVTSPKSDNGGTKPRPAEPALQRFALSVRDRYSLLSSQHIFQWGTHYRDQLLEIAEYALSLSNTHDFESIGHVIAKETKRHSEDVFLKGYEYAKNSDSFLRESQWVKSLSGLKHFLDLVTELYVEKLRRTNRTHDVLSLRQTCSSLLSGILQGFAATILDGVKGSSLLQDYRSLWIPFLAFLTVNDLDSTLESLVGETTKAELRKTVLPVVGAVEMGMPARSFAQIPVCIPLSSQYKEDAGRLLITLAVFDRNVDPRHSVDLAVFVTDDHLSDAKLDEVSALGASIVVGPSSPAPGCVNIDGGAWHFEVIATTEYPGDELAQAIHLSVRKSLAAYLAGGQSAPLTVNVARKFPLHNPFKTVFYLVQRPSVRRLLRGIETQNGVHLWCSPRRSGKTTACFSLGPAFGTSRLIAQTCVGSGQFPDDHVLIDRIEQAIDDGHRLGQGFLEEALSTLGEGQAGAERTVLLLDEYERLFSQLSQAAQSSESIRYRVVEPLLEQIVKFSESNLIVFIGQSPDAHYILMDRNQLSSYIKYDHFPLFPHSNGSESSEFADLMTKVVSVDYMLEPQFNDAIYRETGGHPFLTVQVLISFFDSLIASRRASGDRLLTEDNYLSFAEANFSDDCLRRAEEYQFFRQAISEALGDAGRRRSVWLHAVYKVMREIALNHPRSLSCRRDEYLQVCEDLRFRDALGLDPLTLLSQASKANFFTTDGWYVSPRINLLGRIARISIPKVG